MGLLVPFSSLCTALLLIVDTHVQLNSYHNILKFMCLSLSLVHLIFTSAGGSAAKESACNTGDPGWIPGLGRSAGE